jgi:serine/threonine protein kinase
LKEIPKDKFTSLGKIYSYINEPIILKKLAKYSNFLSQIIVSFQDYDNLYLITKYFEGSNLHGFKNMIFSEDQIKFISACIIQSLNYLRKEEIIHRDVKMKNLVMDEDMYINLIDFSFSINYADTKKPENFFVISPLESPPETRKFCSYDYNSDYYRIGVIIYYLIFKKYINKIKDEISIDKVYIDHEVIKNYSLNCLDFLNKLIVSDYKKRIGFKSINELKEHVWFKGFNWSELEKKKMKSPLNYIKNTKTYCNGFKIKRKRKNKRLKKYDFVNKIIINKIFKAFKEENVKNTNIIT